MLSGLRAWETDEVLSADHYRMVEVIEARDVEPTVLAYEYPQLLGDNQKARRILYILHKFLSQTLRIFNFFNCPSFNTV